MAVQEMVRAGAVRLQCSAVEWVVAEEMQSAESLRCERCTS